MNITAIFFHFSLFDRSLDKENKSSVGLQTQVEVKTVRAELVDLILGLKQDRTVRSELEPAFQQFIKQRHLHPGTMVQQCLLSLL